MGTYLVTGGNKGIGAGVANALRARGDSVYTCHRTEPDDFKETWLSADFLDETDLMGIVRYFTMMPIHEDLNQPHVQLDGVIIAAVSRSPDSSDVGFSFDCRDAFTVNVLAPMMLVKYLGQFDVLKPGGAILFLDREQALTDTNSQYMLSKAAIPEAAHILETRFPDTRVKHITHSASFDMVTFVDRVLNYLVEVPNA